MEAKFEPIEHTADVGYRLFAPTIEELFVVAAHAMFDAITDIQTIQSQLERRIEVTASDLEALLVAWLAELNFLCITGLEIFNRFEIESFSENHLSAVVYGEKIDLKRHEINTEIKAVTYHGLYLRQTEGGWEGQVIFDV